MRKFLTVAILALVLVALVTATWTGIAAVVLGAPVALAGLAVPQPLELLSPDFDPLTRPTATALLRGPPSSGFTPQTTRTTDKESACQGNADSPRSSPT